MLSDRLPAQKQAETTNPVLRFGERRGSIRHYSWRKRNQGGIRHCERAKMGRRRRWWEGEEKRRRDGREGQTRRVGGLADQSRSKETLDSLERQ